MSKYTTEVRFYCETLAGKVESTGYNGINEVLDICVDPDNPNRVFNFEYPCFDPEYKPALEKKILRHYYTREISEETVGLWKLRLEDRMNMIMPYYNKLYESELIQFDPMREVDITTTSTTVNDGTTDLTEARESGHQTNVEESENIGNSRVYSTDNELTSQRDSNGVQSASGESTEDSKTTGNSTTGNVSWQLYSDTPQGGIDHVNGYPIEPGSGTTTPDPLLQYLTQAQKNTSDTTTAETGTEKNTQSTTTETTNATQDAYSENEQKNETDNFTEDRTNNRQTNGTANEQHTSSNVISNTEDYIQHVVGKNSATSLSRLLNEFRKTFLNIDQMIIDELQDLFFGLW